MAFEGSVRLRFHPGIAVEFHGQRFIRSPIFPDITVPQPIFRQLDLIAIHELLPEQSVFITDSHAGSRNSRGCHGIHKTGCQSAQSPIAQAGVHFIGLDLLQIQSQFPQSRLSGFPDT
ncbi:hypothetical protein SDC9_196681 [bioreactor metagenome]|uniref:Uncharacterized protein n=1 Tax=bioreactor metagenome TaxID=1076179 RepID=A0A645ICN1_9ZZZZ